MSLIYDILIDTRTDFSGVHWLVCEISVLRVL